MVSRSPSPATLAEPRSPTRLAALRPASIASGIVFVAIAAYAALTWDAFLTNFQVRWMCDEDRAFVLMQSRGVAALAIPGELARRDPRARASFEPSYPLVVVEAGAPASGAPDFTLAERWPKLVRQYWGYGVLGTELSVVDRRNRNRIRVLGSTSLYRRVERGSGGWRALRAALAPPAEQCTASDRVDFVRRVLLPPD
jgi:hypothetical protein